MGAVRAKASSILVVFLAALGLVWTPSLAGLVTLVPGEHHAHIHAHAGTSLAASDPR